MTDANRRDRLWRWLYRRLGDETHRSVELGLLEELGVWLLTGSPLPQPLAEARWTDANNAVFRRPRQALLFIWLLLASFTLGPVVFVLVGAALMTVRWLYNRVIRTVIARYRDDLRAGLAVEHAVELHPHLFAPTIRAALSLGARSSRLPEAIHSVHASLASRNRLHQGLISVAAYPIVAGYVCFTMAWVIAWKVLPTFAEMYAQFNTELPWATRATLSMYESDAMTLMILLVLFLLAGGSLGTRGMLEWFRDHVLRRLPVIGPIVGCVHRAHIDRILAIALRGGARLDDAMNSVAATMSSRTMARRVRAGAQLIASGSGLEAGLAPLRLYSGLDAWLLARAGDADQLAPTLEALADDEDRRRRDHERALLLYLEVAAVLAIGALVAIVALGFMQAHFGLNPLVGYDSAPPWSRSP